MKKIFIFLLLAALAGIGFVQADEPQNTCLENNKIQVCLSDKGIVSISDKKRKASIDMASVPSRFTIDERTLDLGNIEPGEIKKKENGISYFYTKDGYDIEVRYELKEGWRFVTKQIFFSPREKGFFKVNKIHLFQGKIQQDIPSHLNLSGDKYGMALRFREATERQSGYGAFVTVQNPFSRYTLEERELNVQYAPQMDWDASRGAFPSDRLCMGFTDLTGHTLRADMLPEWEYVPDPDAFLAAGPRIDRGEIRAMTRCMRAFLMPERTESVRVHVGWCENDYQIDISTPEGRGEYKRIIDQAAATGSEHVLFTPSNSRVAPLEENTDAWGWENLLWLNVGQKIRKGTWQPGDPLPASVQELVDYADSKGIGLLAYVYPSLPFMQNPEWTAWRTSNGREPAGYTTTDTGIKSFQDWLVHKMIAFARATGCSGFSFDHWWIAYENQPGDTGVPVSSKYQQWFGTRRILEMLQEKAPDLIIDGRQQYHHFGTWTWLAGTYPHPMMSDEQPGSFNAIPDLSTDRVNGARQRYVAYRLMTRDFTPMEILPGFITHQTQRNDSNRVMRRDRFRPRDWDYLGWKYNLISSIATAPYNHVINYLPARSEAEFKAFSDADRAFFNHWLDFTDKNMKYLQHTRPIIGQPMVGRCDGTSAILGEEGYIFVFNPNYRSLKTGFKLNESIGLSEGDAFTLKEIYPQEGKVVSPGILKYGDRVHLEMPGITVRVFRLEPSPGHQEPLLVNTTGEVSVEEDRVALSNIRGKVGDSQALQVILPGKQKIRRMTINGKDHPFRQQGQTLNARVKFQGQYFPRAHSLSEYDPGFQGQTVEATLRIPERINQQLEQRKKDWPVPYTYDDKKAPWLAPSRLLLYIQVAEPYRKMEQQFPRGEDTITRMVDKPIRKDEYGLQIDGKPFPIHEAYNGVYPYIERSNLGIFADISDLEPGMEHTIRVKLPENLRPGQFQGLFIEHVENEYTSHLQISQP